MGRCLVGAVVAGKSCLPVAMEPNPAGREASRSGDLTLFAVLLVPEPPVGWLGSLAGTLLPSPFRAGGQAFGAPFAGQYTPPLSFPLPYKSVGCLAIPYPNVDCLYCG